MYFFEVVKCRSDGNAIIPLWGILHKIITLQKTAVILFVNMHTLRTEELNKSQVETKIRSPHKVMTVRK